MNNDNKLAVLNFLDRYNMGHRSINFSKECADFINEMKAGLRGEQSSLKMIPTYITDSSESPRNKKVIALDAGGTNLRVATIFFDENGKTNIESFEKYPMPGTQGELSKAQFFNLLADYVAPVFNYSDEIGFCFSYPMEMFPNRDGKLIHFSKEVRAKEVEGHIIGEGLLNALKEKGFSGDKKIVLLNDTVSTLLGGKTIFPDKPFDSSIGFILGTGTNTCYSEQNKNITKNEMLSKKEGTTIINIESGGYGKAPCGLLDDEFDLLTQNPGQQRFEKMIAGAYQGGLFYTIFKKAYEANLFTKSFHFEKIGVQGLTTKDINEFTENPYFGNVLSDLITDENDRLRLYFMIECLVQRAAKLVAINLTAVMVQTGAGKNPCKPVCISAEGTTFYKSEMFRTKLDYYINKYMNERYEIYCKLVMAENLNITGTAIAGTL